MSLINDALKRAKEAQQRTAPSVVSTMRPIEARAEPRRAERKLSLTVPILAGILIIGALAFVGLKLTRHPVGNPEKPIAAASPTVAPAAAAPAPVTPVAVAPAPVAPPAPAPEIPAPQPVVAVAAPIPNPPAAPAPEPTPVVAPAPTPNPPEPALPVVAVTAPEPAAAPAQPEPIAPAPEPVSPVAPPTPPEVAVASPMVVPPPAPLVPAKPVLVQGIAYDSSHPWAIINGRTVYVGNYVSGWQVIDISRHSVTLFGYGRTNNLVVGQR